MYDTNILYLRTQATLPPPPTHSLQRISSFCSAWLIPAHSQR